MENLVVLIPVGMFLFFSSIWLMWIFCERNVFAVPVISVSINGSTMFIEAENIGQLQDIISVHDDFSISFLRMPRKQLKNLPDFNGF